MISNEGDDYDIAERDIAEEEDQQMLDAELDDLDDFLLMDQERTKKSKSPTLLDYLKESIKTYNELLDNKKFKSEGERSKIQKIIKTL